MSLLQTIASSSPSLPPAEARVATLLLNDPEQFVRLPGGELAKQAGVSNPTVIRFCRSLGKSGLSEFKLALAAGLAREQTDGGEPFVHAQVGADDSVEQVILKLMQGNSRALMDFANRSDASAFESASRALGATIEDPPGPTRLTATQAMALHEDRGLILSPRQWFLGYRAFLQKLQKLHHGPWCNTTQDITLMFDKPACQAHLARHSTPTPESLGKISSYDHLREVMDQQKHTRVFIKLAHGSSASGVVAYRRQGHRELAITSAELVRDPHLRFYNSLRIRRYTKREDLRALIDFICAEGAQVEAWIPKMKQDGQPIDLRVVVIAGQAKHIVVRRGASPMTNLHLGNGRGDVEALKTTLGPHKMARLFDICQSVGRSFPNSLTCGVDLMIHKDQQRFYVAEVNAFGDLLPNVLWQGEDTYMTQVKALARRMETQ